jgi:hypothetical protein
MERAAGSGRRRDRPACADFRRAARRHDSSIIMEASASIIRLLSNYTGRHSA